MWRSSYASATVQSTAKNFIMKSDSAFTHTYRAYIKTTECGELKLRFWCSNQVDSTWADGSESSANLTGGSWKIESAYIADGGRLPDGSVVEGTQIPVTFNSSITRMVMPGEKFWSDDARIMIPDEHYLVFSWTITTLAAGVSFPYNTENPLVSAYDAPGHAAGQIRADGFQKSANCLFLPDFIGCEREGAKRLELVKQARLWADGAGGLGKPMIMSEFGADGYYGYRDPSRVKGTEERHADIIERNLAAYTSVPFLSGMLIWQFCDCRVTEGTGWLLTRAGTQNSKGIVDRYRRPKLAYSVVKKYFAERQPRSANPRDTEDA